MTTDDYGFGICGESANVDASLQFTHISGASVTVRPGSGALEIPHDLSWESLGPTGADLDAYVLRLRAEIERQGGTVEVGR